VNQTEKEGRKCEAEERGGKSFSLEIIEIEMKLEPRSLAAEINKV